MSENMYRVYKDPNFYIQNKLKSKYLSQKKKKII